MNHQATHHLQDEHSFIGSGMLNRLLQKMGIGQTDSAAIRMRCLWFVLVTYAVLFILAAVQGVAFAQTGLKTPFFSDISEACRFLLVGPLLILSEAFIEPWLTEVINYTRSKLVLNEHLPEYDRIVGSANKWCDSTLTEIILLVGTFLWQWIDVHLTAFTVDTSWHQLPSTHTPTFAWFWYVYLAKPLIRFLWLRWLYRYIVWIIFLVRLSRLKLKTMPAHPDRHAGLLVISVGHSRFAALAFTFGLQVCGVLGQRVLAEGKTLFSFQTEVFGVLGIVILLFLTPLLAFTGKLLNAQRAGLFEYGSLADEYVCKFHSKWIKNDYSHEEVLGTSDIQSLADLSNSYSIVREMKTCMVGKDNIFLFILATFLPMSPLILTVYPFDELLKNILKSFM